MSLSSSSISLFLNHFILSLDPYPYTLYWRYLALEHLIDRRSIHEDIHFPNINSSIRFIQMHGPQYSIRLPYPAQYLCQGRLHKFHPTELLEPIVEVLCYRDFALYQEPPLTTNLIIQQSQRWGIIFLGFLLLKQ